MNTSQRQAAAGENLSRMRNGAAGPSIDLARGDTFGHDAPHWQIAVGPRIEQRRQMSVRIAEQ